MPSPTDFNLSPYYDDFDKSKGYHRILFRPAFAVQARELTQSQTILQNQVETLSDHFFEKGAMVLPGEIGYDLNYESVKLSAKSLSTLSSYVGATITGATSGVVATVINSTVTDGTDPDTVFVKYTRSGTDNVTTRFANGETLNCTINSAAQTLTVTSTHTGAAAEIQAGTYYINGYHVEVANQVLIMDKYTNTPSYRVGLTVTESFITSNNDASLNDNAQGSSNLNAPGAHRFKINLSLTKLTLTSITDTNFVELLRLKSGILQNQVRTTEYAVIEDTLARRTFDESGDYAVRGYDIDVREHLISGTNRGIFTSENGGLENKLAVGVAPGKAYVKGYEIGNIGTTYIALDKARTFDSQQNFPSRYSTGNFVNVTNIYGSPDVGFVSGDVASFKGLELYERKIASRGTQLTASGVDMPKIGFAKSRGFEYKSGTASGNIQAQTGVYKHFLFDIQMLTHLHITTNPTFTNGEVVTGGTSGATGVVNSNTTEVSKSISAATKANPAVITATGHTFQEGMQVKITGVSGMTQLNNNVYTVRNPAANTFELYDSEATSTSGQTSIDSSAYGTWSSGGAVTHNVTVLQNVKGTFVDGETVTGGTSTNSGAIQQTAVGWNGVRTFDFSAVKSLGMAGSPTYTSDVSDSALDGENANLTGTYTVANSNSLFTGFGSLSKTELRIGDIITYKNDAGGTVIRTVESIVDENQFRVSANVGGSDVGTKTTVTRTRGKLQDTSKNISVLSLPYTTIKTLKTTANNGISDTSYTVRRHYVQTLSNSGTASITAGTNETFAAHLVKDFSVSIMSTGSGGTGAVGDVLTLAGSGVFTLTGSPTGKQLDIDLGSGYAGHKIKILATINRTIADSKSKTLNANTTLQISTAAAATAAEVGLGKADIFKINSIKMAANFSTNATASDTDITDRFDLDNGQRDNYYDIGRIKLKTGAIAPTGRMLINFDFFSHGTGDFFDVDSYSGVVTYETIPTFTSDTTGETFDLRDVLDFRPRVDDASTIDGGVDDRSFDGTGASVVDVIKFDTDVTSDHEYYLGRIDKIFLDKDGQFKTQAGSPAIEPQVPANLDGAMHMYTLDIPAYTLSPDDVGITIIDNRRYTMRDIGKLEKRIENVEYYTQLSLLENSAQTLQIQDANGFDRFKNGFLVDNFTGHGVGNVGNKDYKVSMDMAKGEMRPMFNEDAVSLIEIDDDGTALVPADRAVNGYQKTGDLLTLPYASTPLISQPFASKTQNVNPFDIFNWSGTVALTPDSDEWKETERSPELVINNTGGFDTLVSGLGNSALAGVEIGTVWNEWQDTWSGQPIDQGTRDVGGTMRSGRRVFTRTQTSTLQQVNQTRSGIRQRLVPQVVRNSIGDRVVSVAFVPFIRSRTISFNGTRMKPFTRVFPFFDEQSIASFCTPTGGSLGGNLVTDTNGAVSGTFAIPDPTVDTNPRWRTGERVFRLTDSSTNSQLDGSVQTSAEADYVARGILETVQNTIISTREPRLVRETVNGDTRTIARASTRDSTRTIGWVDPLAQTFLIDDVGGVFLTDMDLYFSTKDASVPITVQIREVVNGYPGKTILPFSEKTLNPGSVSVSTDASVATKFTFDSPVYIQENVEYCFVVLANSNNYNMYVGRLGEKVIGSDRTISQQPYTGVLFKSQNGSTWVAEQNEDAKFILNRAEFSQTTGTVSLSNAELPVRTLKANPFRTTNSSGVVRVFHPNHGMHGTSNNVTIAGVASGTYNGLAHSLFNTTHTSISNVTLDSYDITLGSNANASGDVGGTSVTATQNRLYDVGQIAIQTMEVPSTTIAYTIRPTSGRAVHGTQAEFALTTAANSISVNANDNIYFTAPQMVASAINETNEMSSAKSLMINASFTTTNTKLSPVIDTQRMSLYAISNRLNQPTTGNTPDFVADTKSTGTSSSSVYATRSVTLENTATALDVRLTSNVRTSSSVSVFFRASSAAEARDIENVAWTPFNVSGEEDTAVKPAEDNTTFNEYKYSKSGIDSFSAFQIKIVLKGTNSAYPPVIKDMRGIALAV